MSICVLHIADFFEIGGIESRLIDFWSEPMPGFRFGLFSPRPIPPYWQRKLQELKIPFGYGKGQKNWESELCRFALQLKTDIAHFHQLWPKAKIGLHQAGIRVILEHDHGTVWGCTPDQIKSYRGAREIVDGVIAVSDANRELLMQRLGYPAHKVTTIHNGVNFKRLKVTEDLPRPHHKKVIVTVCRLVALKGVDSLLQSIPRVVKAYPEVEFWIVGEGGLEQELKQLASQSGIEPYVRFWGKQREVANFLAAADIFVLPSIREPFGGVLIEAGYFAKPAIAANIDGNPEIVVSGKTGQLIDPTLPVETREYPHSQKSYRMPYFVVNGTTKQLQKPSRLDPACLGNAILKLLNQPETCKALGQKAHQRVVKRFDIQRYCTELIAYYLKKAAEKGITL